MRWASIDTGIDLAIPDGATATRTLIVHSGGTAPFPTNYRYESAVRDLGEVVVFGKLRYLTRRTGSATVQLRTCDSAAACANEPWSEVENFGVPSVPVRRFAQYAVELTSDADRPTAFDWFELTYSVRKQ